MTTKPDPPKHPDRFVRMWHKRSYEWCWAWDIEESAFRAWKEGNVALASSHVYLPDGYHPQVGSQVVCGTCKSTDVRPKEMRTEFMRL